MPRNEPENLRLDTDDILDLNSGQGRAALDSAIESALADCINRPLMAKVRKVKVDITITPKVGHDTEGRARCGGYDIVIQATPAVPPRITDEATVVIDYKDSNSRQLDIMDMTKEAANG